MITPSHPTASTSTSRGYGLATARQLYEHFTERGTLPNVSNLLNDASVAVFYDASGRRVIDRVRSFTNRDGDLRELPYDAVRFMKSAVRHPRDYVQPGKRSVCSGRQYQLVSVEAPSACVADEIEQFYAGRLSDSGALSKVELIVFKPIRPRAIAPDNFSFVPGERTYLHSLVAAESYFQASRPAMPSLDHVLFGIRREQRLRDALGGREKLAYLRRTGDPDGVLARAQRAIDGALQIN